MQPEASSRNVEVFWFGNSKGTAYTAGDPINRNDPRGLVWGGADAGYLACVAEDDYDGGVCPVDDDDSGGYLGNFYPSDTYDSDTVLSNDNIAGCSVVAVVCDLRACQEISRTS